MYEARYVILAFNAKATNLFSNRRGQGDKVKKSESIDGRNKRENNNG